jgi:hypothetical protein
MGKFISVCLCVVLAVLALPAAAGGKNPSSIDPPISPWLAPAFYTAPASGRSALVTTYPPLPLIPLAPCRLVDTRGNGAPLTGGFLPAATVRSYTLTGVCNVPAGAQAVSLNATVVKPVGPGFLTLWAQGDAFPPVSTLNYLGNDVIVNAAVVPLSASGGISMALGVSGGDVILDVNGFYGPTPADPSAYFSLINNSSGYTMRLTNQSTSCGGTCGLSASVLSGNAIGAYSYGSAGFGVAAETYSTRNKDAAVNGESYGATGSVYGVRGRVNSSTSTDSAGVLGIDGTGQPGDGINALGRSPAGVRGESRTAFGVIGISNYVAVSGALYNFAGASIAGGWIGLANGASPWGVLAAGNSGATGTKSFVEPHPTDPARVVKYVSLEGREAGTYFRGSGQVVGGEAVIDVPEDFRWVTAEEGMTVHVTTVGGPGQTWVESYDLDRIVVRSNRDVKFHYLVQGFRKAYKDFQPVSDGAEFRPQSPADTMPAYLSEEAKRRLVANGTYNADGTVNMNTAERLGWARAWRDQEAAAAAKADTPRAGHTAP